VWKICWGNTKIILKEIERIYIRFIFTFSSAFLSPRRKMSTRALSRRSRCKNYARCSEHRSRGRNSHDAREIHRPFKGRILTKHEKALDKQARDVNAKLIEENDIFRVVLRGDAGRLVFSGEFTPLNIFAISLGSTRE
jgi:hypothetical protein